MGAESARPAVDPVCGMHVDPAGPLSHEHAGERYVFCGPACLKKFRDDPARYLDPAAAAPEPAAPGTKYTCPMHPEVVREEPGSCPICRMALEPGAPTDPHAGHTMPGGAMSTDPHAGHTEE